MTTAAAHPAVVTVGTPAQMAGVVARTAMAGANLSMSITGFPRPRSCTMRRRFKLFITMPCMAQALNVTDVLLSLIRMRRGWHIAILNSTMEITTAWATTPSRSY